MDVLISVDGMKFENAWPSRTTVDFGGVDAYLISLDDLITIKRAAGRSQDLRDVESLLQAQQQGPP